MENKTFDKIVALAGAPGLYFVVGQRPNGLILEEIGNPTRKFATSARQKVSVLADIAMFTEDEDVKLGEILLSAKKLEDNGTSIPNKKDAEENIIEVFGKVLTNYDKERVRVSDMKKLFSWYHILKGNFDFNLINKVDEENKEEIATDGKKTKVSKSKAPKAIKQKVKAPSGPSKQSKISTPRKSS